jgi:2-polyprenyl-3-methyl-5-hydroxy-6-metoxy-1,4-benzoquinol methylase
MKKDSSTECWNNYPEWILHAQTNDYRNHFIMPFTLRQLGDVTGKIILDIGCGEGGYARELAKMGAQVTAVDCSERSLDFAVQKAAEEHLEITHYLRNSCDLNGIANDSFDIVLSSMMLMDCEDFDGTVREIARVLKPQGRLFASVLHPAFYGKNTYRKINCSFSRFFISSRKRADLTAFVVDDYFSPAVWMQPMTNEKAQKPLIFRHRTLQDYFKTFLKYNLRLTDLHEPVPNDEQVKLSVRFSRLKKIPLFLFFEWEK